MKKDYVEIVCAEKKNGYVMGVRGKVVKDETVENRWTFKDNDCKWESHELAVVISDMLSQLNQEGLQQDEEFEVVIRRKRDSEAD